MRINILNLLLVACLFVFASCEEEETTVVVPLEVQVAEDIPANPDGSPRDPAANFTFYDLDNGQILADTDSAGTEWDIALSGTTILVNGGTSGPGDGSATIIEGLFDEMTDLTGQAFTTDSETGTAIPAGSGEGWYTYTGPQGSPAFAVLPIPGRVIALTTGDGNYAKIEILSYYQGNPDTTTPEFADTQTRPSSRYYTFRYLVQPNGTAQF